MIQMRRVTVIPAIMQMRFRSPQAAAAAVSWWLSGGISAANAIGVYQPKEAASYAASKSNLANPGTYDATDGVGGASAWASGTGWTFNGITQYLDSQYVPNTGNHSASVQFNNVAADDRSLFGVLIDVNARFGVYPSRAGSGHYYDNGGGNAAVAGLIAAGNLTVAAQNGYLNGAFDQALAAWTGVNTGTCIIGARRRAAGVIDNYIAVNITAFSLYSTALTAGEVLALSTRMAAL